MPVSPVLLQEGGRWNRRIYGNMGQIDWHMQWPTLRHCLKQGERWGTWIAFWLSHMDCGMCLAALTRTCMYTHSSVHVHAYTHGGGRWKIRLTKKHYIYYILWEWHRKYLKLWYSQRTEETSINKLLGGMVGKLSFGKVCDGLRECCSVKLSLCS